MNLRFVRLPEFSPQVRRVLRIDVVVTLCFAAFAGLTGPFNGLILRRELGATPLQLSLLASANAACLLLSLGLARIVDGRRPLRYVVWPGFIARGLFLLTPLIGTPWPFVAIIVAGSLLGTVSGPAQTALVDRVYPREERGCALGVVRVSGAIFGIVLAAVAGQIMGWFSYRWVFVAAAALGMLGCLHQLRLPVPTAPRSFTPERPGPAEAWRTVRRDAGYRRVLLGSFVFGSGIWMQMPATPLLLADVLKVTNAQVGYFAALAAVAALVANIVWGRLVDRRSSLTALRGVYAIGILTPLIYAVARRPWMLVATSISESVMTTGLDLVWMLVVIDFAGSERTAQYSAISNTLAGVRGIIGPLCGAALIHAFGIQSVYLVSAGLMACGAWLTHRQVRDCAGTVSPVALEVIASAPRIHQKVPRYAEQPRHTSGGRVLVSAARNAR